MKKILIIGIALLSIFILSGCNNVKETEINELDRAMDVAIRLCNNLYVERELMPQINEYLANGSAYYISISDYNDKGHNCSGSWCEIDSEIHYYFDGIDTGNNCYYKDFMPKEYYDTRNIINKTNCCSIWDDYRVVCRWDCKE